MQSEDYSLTRINDSIVECTFHSDILFTQDIARTIYNESNWLIDGKYAILWTMNTFLKPEKRVMDYFASSERANRITCEAFFIENHLLKFTANFYFRVKKPVIPSQVFNDRRKALEWLETHSKKD